jgi:hypothetical protein
MTDPRNELMQSFLKKNKLSEATIEELPADASFRKYFRISTGNATNILMDAAPGKENVKPFIAVAEYLSKHEFSVPQIIAQDTKNGFLLLEDFGSDKFTTLLAQPDQELEQTLYKNAVDVLLALQKVPPADGLIPYYSDNLFLEEVNLFLEYYIAVVQNEPISKKLREEFEIIWQHLLQYAHFIPETIVLRDYHADNLMWLPERDGIQQVGILDFQDAVIGSPVYDVVSLIEDARRDVSPEIAQQMINRYLEGRTDISRKNFLAVYSILAAQRNLKIIGLFARKATRDKNPSYLKLLPRVWGYIEKDLKHPLLLPLKAWLDKVIAPELRKAKTVAA